MISGYLTLTHTGQKHKRSKQNSEANMLVYNYVLAGYTLQIIRIYTSVILSNPHQTFPLLYCEQHLGQKNNE